MRRRTQRRITAGVVLALLPVLVLLALESGRADPSRHRQAYWHRMGTTSAGHDFASLPAAHPVAIEPVDASIAGQVAVVMWSPVEGGAAERGGRFDAQTGVITILGQEARLEAELAVPWRPTLEKTLRHEYGHAMLYDWLTSITDEESAKTLFAGAGTPFPNAEAFPKALHPVITEYATTRTDIYGAAYYTSTFDEYLAESYARYLAGKSVGTEASRFLAAIEERGAAVR